MQLGSRPALGNVVDALRSAADASLNPRSALTRSLPRGDGLCSRVRRTAELRAAGRRFGTAAAPATDDHFRSFATRSEQSLASTSSFSSTPYTSPSSSSSLPLERASSRDHFRVVLLSGLPLTTTPNDIRRLTTDTKTSQFITKIEFLRTAYFFPSGKALIYFDTENWAQRFQASCSKRILGGSVIDARALSIGQAAHFHASAYSKHMRSMQLHLDLIDYEAGKLVLLRGIPTLTTEEKLADKLDRRYDLAETSWWRGKRRSNAGYPHPRMPAPGTAQHLLAHQIHLGPVVRLPHVNPDASVASFLVRLKTTHEAMRLARRWHNTYLTPQRFNVNDTGGRYRIDASVVH